MSEHKNQRESLGGYFAFLIVSVLTVAMGLWAFFGNLGDMREYSATGEATVVAPGYEHVERECGANSCHNVTYCTIRLQVYRRGGYRAAGYLRRPGFVPASFLP